VLSHSNPEFRPPREALLIGGTGFIGRALARRFEETGTKAVAISSKEIDLTASDSAKRLAERLRADAAVILLSALTPDKGKDVATMIRNLAMAQNAATALEATPPAQLIYISSDAVYDDAASPFREGVPVAPPSLYGMMHAAREIVFREACARKKVPCAVIRPCAVYGPGDTHNSYGPNRFLRQGREQGKIVLGGEGEETRDHIHVDDLGEIIRLCAGWRSAGTLNAATGQAVSFAEAARLAARALAKEGRQVKIEPTPRSGPITHRHFDVTDLARSLPGLKIRPLFEGLERAF
jgi:nucleoside-diphosphate-sugar epimerase